MSEKSEYRVLARKYRPQRFDDLIGQEPMVRTLSNAFSSGRIAQAYMLTGVRGVGKTTTARILARALNYKTDSVDQPDISLEAEGEHCRAIIEGRHVDVIEMDAASHTGIDDIREIIESVQYAPALARYKVYIIDEVHMLSRSAFNGLLKTLEEPPSHLKFIFATTEIRKVPITVLSRCQRFDLRRIEAGDMVAHLQKITGAENAEAEGEALGMIARASEGSVRDALSILDQAIAHADGKVTADGIRSMLGLADRARVIDLFEHVMSGNIAAALTEMKSQYDVGADPYVVLTDLADFIHYVTRLKYAGSADGAALAGNSAAFSEAERVRGKEFAGKLSVRVLGRAWQILLKGLAEVRASERALAAADMVLVRLTHAVDLPSHEELVRMASEGGKSDAPQPAASAGGGEVPSGGPGAAVSATSETRHGPNLAPPANAPIAFAPREEKPAQHTPQPGRSGKTAADPQPRPEFREAGEPPLVLDGFEQLVFLAEDKRDIRVKLFLRRNVRLVAFKSGTLEFNLVGDPPHEILQHVKERLERWTRLRWNFIISDKEGLPTLEEIELAEKSSQIEKARSHPTVRAVLEAFEGARIVDVRIRETADEGLPAAGEEAGDEPANDDGNLDDFFE
ncbi:DNA polymerase III subunit gamma/tau [Salaquimonas pukyongi]|uniref:DNA polymerase III subunit gamma/tau n=1 Tax=Salaquimonas pukyongi TaxID=2712698 RepID=UPI00096B9F8D|nr:DNA polymerase III subunit gamma/tau [Salaquimonas pukyongi]